jgi:hypothetical protein
MSQMLSKRVLASLLEFNASRTSRPLQRPYHPAAMLPLVSREMYEADRERAASSKGDDIPARGQFTSRSENAAAAERRRYHRSGKC